MNIKTLGNAAMSLTKPSKGLFGGEILPRVLNAKGAAVLGGVMLGANTISNVDDVVKAHNNVKLGKVSYYQGPDRMTQAYGTGVVPAIKKISNNNPEIAQDLTRETLLNNHRIEDFGVDEKFVSAFYGMGGY